MYRSIWLFRFNSYSYCQGTEDTHYGDMRLVSTTLPCSEWEAKMYLKEQLYKERIEYDKNSIESLSIHICNS